MPNNTANPRTLWFLIIGLFIVMTLFASFPQTFDPLLEYQRSAILNGQLWRLISCHLIHLNSYHFLLDGTGLLLITYIFQDVLTPRHAILWFGLSAPLCGALLLLDSQLSTYVGLSGILHGWLTLALVAGFSRTPKTHALVLLVLAAKLFYEQTPFYQPDYLNHLIDGQVYPTAHLYGALIGVGIGLYCIARSPSSVTNKPVN